MKWISLCILGLFILSGCTQAQLDQIENIEQGKEGHIPLPAYLSHCENIADAGEKGECIREAHKDVGVCQDVENRRDQHDCFMQAARVNEDSSLCDLIDDALKQRNCYFGTGVYLATQYKDASFCEIIQVPHEKDQCLFTTWLITRDEKTCLLIEDDTLKRDCFEKSTDSTIKFAYRPSQCLSAPWQQSWVEQHPESDYPRNEIAIIEDYYLQEFGLQLLNVESKRLLDERGRPVAVCEACSCPAGYEITAQIENANAPELQTLGWQRVQEQKSDSLNCACTKDLVRMCSPEGEIKEVPSSCSCAYVASANLLRDQGWERCTVQSIKE